MSDSYEVVIHEGAGVERDHAEMLRKRLIRDGLYEDVVTVREVRADE